MKTYPPFTNDLETCSCPSVLSLWHELDQLMPEIDNLEKRARLINLIKATLAAYSSRPLECTALILLLIIRPKTPSGESWGRF